MSRRIGLLTVFLCVLVALWAVSPERAATNSDSQIILSGTALPASTSPCTPWGMWLWSQQPTNDAYGGSGGNGNGSMYFYRIAREQAHMDVSNVVLSGNAVSESASGTFQDGTGVNCTFAAHQTSPGKGILDRMSCTLTPPRASAVACSASDIPITVDISNATK